MKPQVEAPTKIHSLNGRNLLVLEAIESTAHKEFVFEVKVANKLSPPLHLVKVTKQDVHGNRLSFKPFKPLSGHSKGSISKDLCCDENTFEKEATGKEKTIKFDCENIFGAWDLELGRQELVSQATSGSSVL
jgi:hypothetical protein